MKIFKKIAAAFIALLITTSCASVFPVPGGSETTNQSFYESGAAMKVRLADLEEGMLKKEVFERLGRNEEELTLLKRDEVISALFGSGNTSFRNDINNDTSMHDFLQSLSGYKLNYKIIKRKHGIKNPIRLQTDETGFSYSALLIFKDDVLYEKPILSGGPIDNTSSSTIFDYLNPGTVIDRVE